MLLSEPLKTKLEYYGISPWEIEVIYGFLNSRFTVLQEEIENNDENFVSFLNIDIPLEFNEAFFKWFDFKRWEQVKDVLKEYKRRRGRRNALKIKINFAGNPKIVFTVDVVDRQWFNNAVEKMDFVIELLQHHLDPQKLQQELNKLIINLMWNQLDGDWIQQNQKIKNINSEETSGKKFKKKSTKK